MKLWAAEHVNDGGVTKVYAGTMTQLRKLVRGRSMHDHPNQETTWMVYRVEASLGRDALIAVLNGEPPPVATLADGERFKAIVTADGDLLEVRARRV